MENNDDSDADASIFPQLLLIVILTIVNAFLALSELAIIASNRGKIMSLVDEGNKRAKLVLKLKDNETRFLSTIQVGITLAGFFSSATAARNITNQFAYILNNWGLEYGETVSLITITILLSFFTLIFGELYPKRIALANPEKISMVVVYPINFIKNITYPLVLLLNGVCNLLSKISGLDKKSNATISTEEIKFVVESAAKDKTIDLEKQKMIESVLKFKDLNGTDIMTPRTKTFMLDIEETIKYNLDEIMEMKYSRIPVYSESIDNIVGIINTKDLFQEIINKGIENININDILRTPIFVQEKIKIDVLFNLMKKEKTQIVVLLDEFGGVSGIVTMEDIVEEVVGSIYDEYDEEVGVKKISDNEYVIDGITPIQEVNRETGLELDEENPDYDSISGLIITSLDKFPSKGDSINIDNIVLTVLETEKLQIKKVGLLINKVEEGEE